MRLSSPNTGLDLLLRHATKVALLLALATQAVSLAQAGTADDVVTGEYNRLSHQLRELSERNAWTGVERSYREIRSLGVPLSFADHMSGARAARALGDATSLKQRLGFANALSPGNSEVEGWLQEIARSYGQASLLCDPGKLELLRDGLPFDPNQAAAVRFAQLQVTQRGKFEGLLPVGDYHFGQFDFKVSGGIQTGTIDLRSDGYIRSVERAERARAASSEPKTRKKQRDE